VVLMDNENRSTKFYPLNLGVRDHLEKLNADLCTTFSQRLRQVITKILIVLL
jgi:hypothetical protein